MDDAKVYVLFGETANLRTGMKGPAKCFGVFKDRSMADVERWKVSNGFYDVELPEGFPDVTFRVEEVPIYG